MTDFRPNQNVERVFRRMLSRPYYGRVSFSHFFKMSPEDFHEATLGIDIHKFLDLYPNKFGKYLQENGLVSMVTIRIKGADICPQYFTTGCTYFNCRRLHLCKDYLSQTCKILDCNFCQDIKMTHNQEILDGLNLNDFTHEEIIRSIRLSQPQVCYSYNDLKVCSYQDRCTKLHICSAYVQHNCSNNNCDLKHDLNAAHEKMILKVFDLNPNDADILDKIILYPEGGKFNLIFDTVSNNLQYLNQPENNVDEDDYRNDDVDSSIKSISQVTSKLQSCVLNFKNDVIWQFILAEDIIIDFDEYYSTEIEKAFCDASISEMLIICPVKLLEIFPKEIQLNINFDKMFGIFERNKFEIKIKRTTTHPEDDFFYWYYLDIANNWIPYSDDLQAIIEKSFMQNEKRFLFNNLGKQVRIKFSEMTQKDRNDGTECKIRRRPVFIQ